MKTVLVVPFDGSIEHDPLYSDRLIAKVNALELEAETKRKVISNRHSSIEGLSRNRRFVEVKLLVLLPTKVSMRTIHHLQRVEVVTEERNVLLGVVRCC